MGERRKPDDNVFDWIHSPHVTNSTLREWCMGAGIKKHITFHSGRHTFAVMMLDLGTDIYTVSKLLGHREISTTQIYAKVLDKNKQAAVAKIPSVFNRRKRTCRRMTTDRTISGARLFFGFALFFALKYITFAR